MYLTMQTSNDGQPGITDHLTREGVEEQLRSIGAHLHAYQLLHEEECILVDVSGGSLPELLGTHHEVLPEHRILTLVEEEVG